MVYPAENGNYLIRRSLPGELEGTLDFGRGKNPKEYVFDIFNQAGISIGTISLDVHLNDSFFCVWSPFRLLGHRKEGSFICPQHETHLTSNNYTPPGPV